jgi:hypothetical protein
MIFHKKLFYLKCGQQEEVGHIRTLKILTEVYVLQTSSLHNFHHSSLTSSVLTPRSTALLDKLIVTQNGQEIPCLLRKPKVHSCVHKSLPLYPILSQMYLDCTLIPYSLTIHFNVILPSKASLPSGLFPSSHLSLSKLTSLLLIQTGAYL